MQHLCQVLVKLFDVYNLQSNEKNDGPWTVLDVLTGIN